MSSAARAISSLGLKRRALSLGAVKAFEHVLQFLLPVVLVRVLDAATFGEYRLLWLVVGTLMALSTLNMGGTLYFFVPRSEPHRKRVYIHNTLAFLAAAGILCAAALGPWNPWLPAAAEPLAQYGALVPAFVAVWFAAYLLDHLPTVEERIGWQAWATLSLVALRAVVVGVGAWASGSLEVILYLLVALALGKLGLLLYYIRRHHGLGRPWFERAAFAEQFRHAAPFGVSTALYQLRAQADQWVAASLFALSSFAAFSIASIVGQVVHIFRHSVMEAFMPTMSRMEAAGDVHGMLELNRRANLMVGTALAPFLAAAFVFADELVTLVYTASYLEAAPVIRLYVAGMAVMVIETGSVVLLLRQGAFAAKLSALVLVVSVAASWGAAHWIGLTGAAAGSVLALYLDRAAMLRRVSRLTGVPLARLQDWRGLAWIAASALLAGLAAWLLVPEMNPLSRVLAGGAVVGAVYLALNFRKFIK